MLPSTHNHLSVTPVPGNQIFKKADTGLMKIEASLGYPVKTSTHPLTSSLYVSNVFLHVVLPDFDRQLDWAEICLVKPPFRVSGRVLVPDGLRSSALMKSLRH